MPHDWGTGATPSHTFDESAIRAICEHTDAAMKLIFALSADMNNPLDLIKRNRPVDDDEMRPALTTLADVAV